MDSHGRAGVALLFQFLNVSTVWRRNGGTKGLLYCSKTRQGTLKCLNSKVGPKGWRCEKKYRSWKTNARAKEKSTKNWVQMVSKVVLVSNTTKRMAETDSYGEFHEKFRSRATAQHGWPSLVQGCNHAEGKWPHVAAAEFKTGVHVLDYAGEDQK